MTWPSCHQLSLSQSSWVSFLPFMQTWKSTEEPLAVLSCSYSRDFLSHLLLYVARQEELHLFRGVLKHMMVCSKGMVPILSVIAQVKQNYMTTELFKGAGSSGGHHLQPPAQAIPPRSGCTGHCQAESWVPPRMVVALTSLGPWSGIWIPSWWFFFSDF